MSNRPPLSPTQALWRWVLYVVVFVLAGGLAGGISALAWEGIMQDAFSRELYAVLFGVASFIAYRLLQRTIDHYVGPAS